MGQVVTRFRKTWRATKRPPHVIAVALRSKSKKNRLEEFLAERNPTRITEEIWRELVTLLAPISEGYLRELLHRSNIPVAQPFGGVRQSSFEELESSLLE